MVRGIRGATSVEENTKEAILERTEELLLKIKEKNGFRTEDVASVLLSMTEDLDAAFPAVAARGIGWTDVPLFCQKELSIQGSLQSCIRVLIHLNTEKSQKEIVHVYLHRAEALRPDIVKQ